MTLEPAPRRKRFGQHFLHDPTVIRRILAAVDARDDDMVVEIGPGGGALTDALAAASGRLVAVEIDRDLAHWLEQRYAAAAHVQIRNEDALTLELATLGDTLRIVGNLPYNVSTPLLFRLTEQQAVIRDAVFMLQREVVDRMVAAPGSKTYGRLSVMLQCFWSVEALFRVPAGAFRPPPKVESAVCRLTPIPALVEPGARPRFDQIVRAAFGQRRKTLRRSLGGLMSDTVLVAAGIDPGLRAENLSPADFARLSLQDSG